MPGSRPESQRYNYAEINLDKNKEAPVHVETFSVAPQLFQYDSGGISANIQRALLEQGASVADAKATMFEILQAMEENLAQKGMPVLDELEPWLKINGVTYFSIQAGFVHFFKGEPTASDTEPAAFLSLEAISIRQTDLRLEVYEDKTDLLALAKKARKELLAEIKKRREAMGPSDNSVAHEFELPKTKRQQAGFLMPLSYWLRTHTAPEGLPSEKRDEVLCMGYVIGRLLEKVGSLENLNALGPNMDHKSWQFKADLLARDMIETVSSMQKYLRVGGTITGVDIGSEAYQLDLLKFRSALDQALANPALGNSPFVMTLRYLQSDYAGVSAAYNRQFPPNDPRRSPNTHILFCEGKDKQPLTGPFSPGEELTSFVCRAVGVKPENQYLLNGVTIWVGESSYTYDKGAGLFTDSTGAARTLASGDQVSLEDIYFSHHFEGAKLDSFTGLMASGKFLPVDILRIKSEKLPQETLPKPFQLEGVDIVKCFYLGAHDDLRACFQKKVSNKPEDWELFTVYAEEIGFDLSRVRTDTEPVPVPNFDQLKAEVQKQGGASAMRYKREKERAKLYEKEHPDEHILVIGPTDNNPWELVKPFFATHLKRPINTTEKNQILGKIDQLNASIDLRRFKRPDGKGNEVEDYVRFESGTVIWVSDDLIKNLTLDIQTQRTERQVWAPDTLQVLREKLVGPPDLLEVPISSEEKKWVESSTEDGVLRMAAFLTLPLEQKAGSNRKKIAEFVDEKTIEAEKRTGLPITEHLPQLKEASVGLFQVVPGKEEMEYFGYTDPETFRQALKKDPVLNTQAFLYRLNANRQTLDYYLALNGQSVPAFSQEYMAALLTLHNRPRRAVLNGWFGLMGSQIAQAFGVDLRYQDYEARALGKKSPASSQQIKGINSFRASEETHAFWEDLIQKLIDQKEITLSPEQAQRDLALLIDRRDLFLKSTTYQVVKRAYEDKTGGKLSLVVIGDQFESTAIENYGYRGTRVENIDRIINYSTPLREKALQKIETQRSSIEDGAKIS